MTDVLENRVGDMAESEACGSALSACASFGIRKVMRLVTQNYDEALQPTGLRSTQLSILLGVSATGTSTIANMARQLVMDPSTLNRNLRPLIEKGLIESKLSPDGRRRFLSLSEQGHQAVREALPYWKKAQQSFVDRLGEDRWNELSHTLETILQVSR